MRWRWSYPRDAVPRRGRHSAFAPDVPGCIATGPTRDAVEQTIREAIEIHLDGLCADGITVPEAHSHATVVEVAV